MHQSGKSSKDLTGLYMCHEIQAHEGSIWSIKFSADGQRLASAGEDSVVRVWQVVETNTPPSSLALDGSGKSAPPGPAAPCRGRRVGDAGTGTDVQEVHQGKERQGQAP